MPEKEKQSIFEIRKVGKIGSSLYIIIPPEFAEDLALKKGIYCSIEKKGDTLVISKKIG